MSVCVCFNWVMRWYVVVLQAIHPIKIRPYTRYNHAHVLRTTDDKSGQIIHTNNDDSWCIMWKMLYFYVFKFLSIQIESRKVKRATNNLLTARRAVFQCFPSDGIMRFARFAYLTPSLICLSSKSSQETERKKRQAEARNWWAVKWWANKIMAFIFYHFVSKFKACKTVRHGHFPSQQSVWYLICVLKTFTNFILGYSRHEVERQQATSWNYLCRTSSLIFRFLWSLILITFFQTSFSSRLPISHHINHILSYIQRLLNNDLLVLPKKISLCVIRSNAFSNVLRNGGGHPT